MSGLLLFSLQQTMQRNVLAVLPPCHGQGAQLWHLRQCVAALCRNLTWAVKPHNTLTNIPDPKVIELLSTETCFDGHRLMIAHLMRLKGQVVEPVLWWQPSPR